MHNRNRLTKNQFKSSRQFLGNWHTPPTIATMPVLEHLSASPLVAS